MSTKTVLIVDDDSTNRMIVRKLIENDISAVVMDTDMPVMSGPEAAAKIQRDQSWDEATPLVVLSGRDVNYSKEAFKEVNVSYIFQKPFSHKAFVNVIIGLI